MAIILTGSSIRLRPKSLDDVPLLAEWYNEPDFGGFFVDIPPTTLERLQSEIREGPLTSERAEYLITDRTTGQPLGLAGHYRYTDLPWMHGLEIGYMVHPQARGRGVATQTARLLVDHLFDTTPTQRIQATVTDGNDPSRRVLERAGLTREGPMRRAIFLHSEYRDLHLYSITRDEWGSSRQYVERFPL